MLPRVPHEVAVGDLASVLELLGELHEADDVDDLVVRLTARLAMLITTDSVVIEDAPGTGAGGMPDRLPDPGRLHLTVGPPAERPLRITLVRNGSFGRRDLAVAELLKPHLPAAVSHAALRAATKPATAPTALTRRERQVLDLVAAGWTNRDIGQQLYIQPRTVEKHIANIRQKLGASNRTEAAAIFLRTRVPA